MITEARNERLKHMDELHDSHKQLAELRAKVRDAESKLAEKDAMIKVLQQHSRDREVLQKSIYANHYAAQPTARHGRSASSMGLTTRTSGSDFSKMPLAAGLRPPPPFPRHTFGKYSTLTKETTNSLNESASERVGLPKMGLTKELSGSSASSSPSSGVPESGGSASSSTGSISTSKTNLDEQLKELDLKLTSKVCKLSNLFRFNNLNCCRFFHHPRTP